MKRKLITPRRNWQAEVEQYGLTYHTHADGRPYWNEAAYYEFNARQIDALEKATNDLQAMCLAAGQHIIDQNLFARMGIPAHAVPLIKSTWESEPPAIYGRFDLAYDGLNPPKMLEYNADTPTSLLEAAVIQWYWLKDRFKSSDQFNSIHERLVAKWKELRDYLTGSPVYFAHVDDDATEDTMTVTYLRDTAQEAGVEGIGILMKDIGWDKKQRRFVDIDENVMTSVFKLYPWEWLIHEQFADRLVASHDKMQWLEPAWKMLWSNKAILPILWELYPDHPNLLPTYFGSPNGLTDYVKKPLLSREGANITVVQNFVSTSSKDDGYGEEGYVFQALASIPNIDGKWPVIGSWVIDGESAGMGIRESDGLVTDNGSSFVPHLFE